jgi:DNA polymerase III subunit epsilon
MLKLKRPLAFLDIESTGTDRDKDRIIELAIVIINPDEKDRYEVVFRFNPEMSIPLEASEIHGIYDKDVENEPTFKQKAKDVLDILYGCDIAGFNSNAFDVPLLAKEVQRAGFTYDFSLIKLVDVGNMYKILNPRTLSDAYLTYTGKPLENAHGALPDVKATVEVFEKMLANHSGIPTDVAELDLYSNFGKKRLDLAGRFVMSDNGTVLLNFGKQKGKPALEHKDFLDWMIFKDKQEPGSFPTDTIRIAEKLYHTGEIF